MRLVSGVRLGSCIGLLSLLSFTARIQADDLPAGAHAPEAQPDPADMALRGLLGGARASVDPDLSELEALCVELAAHPLAQTAGRPGLERARAELSRLRQLIGRRADPNSIARRKQLVWAALSLSDRQMARAELATALRDLLQRRAQAEARLREATLERERAQRELDREQPTLPANSSPESPK